VQAVAQHAVVRDDLFRGQRGGVGGVSEVGGRGVSVSLTS
jgi:hypothetical protein